MDQYRFFHEASLRILSSFRIEKAFYNCLTYIREHIPADFLTLNLFDPGLSFVETLVAANAERGERIGVKTQLTPGVREQIQSFIDGLNGNPQCTIVERMGDDPMTALVAKTFDSAGEACLILDLMVEGKYLGIATLSNARGLAYTQDHAQWLRMLHEPFAWACANYLSYRDLEELKDRLADNYRSLQDDLIHIKGGEIIGAEQGLKTVMEMVRQVAPATTPVLLLGETGVGKEVVAQAVHRLSARREGPIIKVDCGAIPENLVESELFGHEKGAFTGAMSAMRGRLERAHGGTLFLDEIGELSLETQKRILRVLEESVIERVGGEKPIHLDIRIIAATHRPLETMVQEKTFRQDLFFRLNVFPIAIPPLRDRPTDIPLFVSHFIKRKSRKLGLPGIATVAPGAIDILTAYQWPGNVRELKNLVERELILCGQDPVAFASLSPAGSDSPAAMPVEHMKDGALSFDAAVADHIRKVLEMTQGRVEGPKGAARLLDVHPRTLQHRMKKLGIPYGREYKRNQKA